MFDLNRPLHAYDADKIDNEIIVRNSKDGEEFEALDNKNYKLKKECALSLTNLEYWVWEELLSEQALQLNLETKNILLECFFFSYLNKKNCSRVKFKYRCKV